jgi:peptidoglycan hydrolase-like protein with peptidoglycan-binding domain
METTKTQTTAPPQTAASHHNSAEGAKEKFSFSELGLTVSPKLSIGSPDDPLEREADDMADKVMRMEIPEPISFSQNKNSVSRKCAHCEEEEKKELNRKENSSEQVSEAPTVVHDVLNSSGHPMDADTRSFMESRFNYDFSDVKIHNGDLAAKSADSINALAYTSGNNLVFNSGQYNTNSDPGKRLLAHELTHVVQQQQSVQPKTIQRSWDWGRAAIGGLIGLGAGAAVGAGIGALIGGGVGAGIGALIGGIAGLIGGGLIGGLTGSRHLSSPRLDNNAVFEAILNGRAVMRVGDTGPEVRRIQQLLIDIGIALPVNGANGTFTAETENGVKEFQRRNGLPDTGIVDSATIEKFDNSFPAVTLPSNRSDPWNMACVLQILCAWNRHLVENVLPGFNIITFDSRTFPTETWDGATWVPGTFTSGGFRGGTSMGFLNTTSCEEFAFTIYHEGWHGQQPSSLTGVVDTETDAYVNTEQWSIDMGLPGQGGLRTTAPNGEEVVDIPAAESLVRHDYGGVSSIPGERILHRVGPTNVRVRRADGTEYERPAAIGESVRGAVVMTNQTPISSGSWVCP